jgi:hypothetical protein
VTTRPARTLATFGRAHLFEGGDPQRAFAAVERAVTLVPGREEYHVLLGHALVLQGEYTRAAAQLGPLWRVHASRKSAITPGGCSPRSAARKTRRCDRARAVEARRTQAAEAGAGSRDEPQPALQAAEAAPAGRGRTGRRGALDARAGSRSRRWVHCPPCARSGPGKPSVRFLRIGNAAERRAWC